MTSVLWGAASLAVLLACRQSDPGEGTGSIENPPYVTVDPTIERPMVVFPAEHHQSNPEVNKFIQRALQICADGDYDRFRELFGLNFRPPPETQFQKVWKGVKQVSVAGVYADPRKADEYYVHVLIQLRKRNRADQNERQAVVWVHKEEDDWRLGTAPSDITRRVLAPRTQPAASMPEHGIHAGASTATAPAGQP